MQVDVQADKKTVSVWLSHDEQGDGIIHDQLKELYAAYAPRKYRVFVFYSGHVDLSELTLNLLKYNMKKLEQNRMEKEALFL